MAMVSSASLQNLRIAAYDTLARAKRGDRDAQDRLLTAAVGISLLVHGVLLAVRFVVADERRPAVSPPLEVVLVNSKSATKPYKAELLAQHNLDGGGNTDAKRRGNGRPFGLAALAANALVEVSARPSEVREAGPVGGTLGHTRRRFSRGPRMPG